MRPPERFGEIAATPQPPLSTSELRDWGNLPDLVITDVLDRLFPCLRSLSAFAGTCRPWRRFFLATVAPRIPPLMLRATRYTDESARLIGLSPALIGDPVAVPLPAFSSKLLSTSRGHLILLKRGITESVASVVDAFTGAERLAVPLPDGFAYHYASLTPTHLLLFHTRDHRFDSLRFPTLNPDPQWTPHRLPRGASFLSTVIEFHGRVLGVTHRAELLEFRLDVNAPRHSSHAVQLLPTTGLPDPDAAATFDRLRYGPRLVAAGERLLLLLIMTDPPTPLETRTGIGPRVQKVSVYALDMATMTWEELDNIGEYSLFVDCPGRSAMACADAARCGVVANRVYLLVSSMYYDFGRRPPFHAFAPGPGRDKCYDSPWSALISHDRDWPPAHIWVYPSLFYQSCASLFIKSDDTLNVATRTDYCNIL
ncbi:LOW QUALITY PROTEIN: hypothetical protein CFC21_058913 [Triticum aestivum]|uniref:KIB1-4 beta-propeller domain-containing protein n=2 Tax=Triticum aestivum TaxID=4565 RepID=A0A9R1KDZ8_WHEAT|nr:LOW QUALITY PROTEIN: hypothetical protein CFC21_058913 [Triticum aestivum]